METSNWIFIGGIGIVSFLFFIFFKNRNSSIDKNERGRRKNVLISLKNADIKYSFPLLFKENVSHNTRRFRFSLPSSLHVLGLPVGQHIYLTTYLHGELIKRPYTPITSDDNQGYFDLIIKIYPNGKMSEYLDKLRLGQTIDVNGPAGNLIYRGNGIFDIRARKCDPFVSRRVRHLGLIAGGTGITPIYQIITQILRELKSNETFDLNISLLFANQSEDDILLRDQIEQLSSFNPTRFRYWYTIERANQQWKYSKGFLNDLILAEHLPPPSDQLLICLCGPPAMIQFACLPNLDKLGYTQSMIYIF